MNLTNISPSLDVLEAAFRNPLLSSLSIKTFVDVWALSLILVFDEQHDHFGAMMFASIQGIVQINARWT